MISWRHPRLGHPPLAEAVSPVRLAAGSHPPELSVPSWTLLAGSAGYDIPERTPQYCSRATEQPSCLRRSCHTWVGDSAKHQHYRGGDGDGRYRDRFRAGSLRTHRAKSGPVAGDGNREARDLCSGLSLQPPWRPRVSQTEYLGLYIPYQLLGRQSGAERRTCRRLARPSILGILGGYHGLRQVKTTSHCSPDLPLFPWRTRSDATAERAHIGKDETGEEVYSTLPPSPNSSLGAQVSRPVTVSSIFPGNSDERERTFSNLLQRGSARLGRFPPSATLQQIRSCSSPTIWQDGWRMWPFWDEKSRDSGQCGALGLATLGEKARNRCAELLQKPCE